MEFQTILFVFGAILFVVGLVGHIKAKEIEVGTTSKTVRVLSFALGTVFIILSFVYPSHQKSKIESINPSDNVRSYSPLDKKESTSPSPDNAPFTPKNDVNRIADATFTYWEKCKENDKYYTALFKKEDSIIDNSTLSNKIRGEANIRKANLIREYLRSEKDISTAEVDLELVEMFSRLRGLYNQRANYFERIGDVLLSVGDSPDDATANLANNRVNAAVSDDDRLQLKVDQLGLKENY